MRKEARYSLPTLIGPSVLILAMLACSIPGQNQPTAESTATHIPPAATVMASPTISSLTTPPPTPIPASAVASPTIPPAAAKGPYAVILVPSGDVLNVRQEPNSDSAIIDRLQPDAKEIMRTGKYAQTDDQRWAEIQTPAGGTGWVNIHYLTEAVPPAKFCNDPRVNLLLDRLVEAMNRQDGELFASLVSPAHGLSLTYLRTGNTANYSVEEARWLFKSTYVTNWGTHPASGQEVKATFRDEVLPQLLEVLSGGFARGCNELLLGASNYIFEWPFEYRHINFYSLHKPGSTGVELDWRTWLVGVEYVDGQPYLFALIHLFWEP